MPGLYVHIPFCRQACYYCDFHFSTSRANQEIMVRSIVGEMNLQREYLDVRTLDSIYFGGGTPSLLTQKQAALILDSISKYFIISDNCELTLEANPDDLTESKLVELRELGFNRLSIGVQSFDDDVLKFMNRAHDSNQAQASILNARKAGFDNISLDLIYAVPGQNNELWKKNIDKALAFHPTHISTYSLTIEPKTVFGNWYDKNKISAVDETENALQYEVLIERLAQSGYEHYEISNFCAPGFYSRHNSSYWKQEPYLGLGPSAHSYNITSRQFNVKNNAQYIKAIEAGEVPFEREILTRENKINEYIFTTLRTQWGCDLDKLKSNYHYDLARERQELVSSLVGRKLVTMDKGIIKLTREGKLLADQISLELMV